MNAKYQHHRGWFSWFYGIHSNCYLLRLWHRHLRAITHRLKQVYAIGCLCVSVCRSERASGVGFVAPTQLDMPGSFIRMYHPRGCVFRVMFYVLLFLIGLPTLFSSKVQRGARPDKTFFFFVFSFLPGEREARGAEIQPVLVQPAVSEAAGLVGVRECHLGSVHDTGLAR